MTNLKIALVIFTLTAINFSFQVDFVVFMPLGPTLMKKFLLSPSEFSLLVSVYTLAAGVTSIIFSLITNLFNKKYFLLSALFLLGVSSYFTGQAQSLEQLFMARFFAGCFSGVVNPLIFAIATDLIPFERRGKAMGWIMSGFSIASVLGIPIGLYLSDEFGHRMTFSSIAVVFLLVFLLTFFVIPSIPRTLNKVNLSQLVKDFRRCINLPEYLKGYGLLFFVSGGIFLIVPLLSPFAVNNMGVDIEDLKFMYLAGGILTIITSRIFGVLTDKFGPTKIFITVGLLSAIPVILFSQSSVVPVIQFIIVGSLMMSFMSGQMVPSMTLVTKLPEASDRGVFNGILNSMRGFGSSIFAESEP